MYLNLPEELQDAVMNRLPDALAEEVVSELASIEEIITTLIGMVNAGTDPAEIAGEVILVDVSICPTI